MSFNVLNCYRIRMGPMASDDEAGNNGAFRVPSQGYRLLWVVASDGLGWEHVSVHATENRRDQTPTWDEMCRVKALFWDPEDVVMQLHPRQSQYVNDHPHVLHLWRPLKATIPEPPSMLVGRGA